MQFSKIMEKERGDQRFWTEEWTIENFSCWDRKIHGVGILHSNLFVYTSRFRLELYPKGLSGGSDRMEVLVYDEERSNGELCLISADGSVLCKLEVRDINGDGSRKIKSTGLSFEEVVSGMVKTPFHKDSLTLRYRKRQVTETVCSVRNRIDVVEKFVEIPAERFRVFPWANPSTCNFYFLIDGKFVFLKLTAFGSAGGVVSLELKLSNVSKAFLVKCCVYASNEEGDLLRWERHEHAFSEEETWTVPCPLPSEDLVRRGLSLLVRIKFVTGEKSEHYTNHFANPEEIRISDSSSFPGLADGKTTANDDPVAMLTRELARLYHQDRDFSDFQLRCENVAFPAHRAILSARSPVFKAMLSAGDMREAASGTLDVEDLDPRTLGRFLAFLYTGASDEDLQWEDAVRLYYAADKYQVPSLKRRCSAVLSAGVSTSNVCDVLSLADMHQDGHLASVARDFVLDNYNQVLKSEEWERFIKKDPVLLCKTLTYLGSKNYVGKK